VVAVDGVPVRLVGSTTAAGETVGTASEWTFGTMAVWALATLAVLYLLYRWAG
jgi:hypothetical protein